MLRSSLVVLSSLVGSALAELILIIVFYLAVPFSLVSRLLFCGRLPLVAGFSFGTESCSRIHSGSGALTLTTSTPGRKEM